MPAFRLVAAVLMLAAGPSAARAGDATAELPAGGLAFVPSSVLAKDSEELLIGRDRIRVTYVIRNSSDQDLALWISFPLPDIDMSSVGDQEVMLPSPDPQNFVEFETLVDNTRISGQTFQAAFAAGRDVSRLLAEHSIPLFPFVDGLAASLGELPEAVRRDWTERGILRHDAERAEPGWVLKTSVAWRQVFPAGRALRIVHTYRPIAAMHSYSPAALAALQSQHCVDGGVQAEIAKRQQSRREVTELLAVTYLAAPGANWSGPTGDYRIAIEKPDSGTIVATCWRELRAAGPTLLEWGARVAAPDEDLHILFIR